MAAYPVQALIDHFGDMGRHVWRLAHGLDDRSVVPDREAKSISTETTFPEDIDEIEVLRACVLELAEQVGWRLRRHELRGRTVQIKVRFADFHTITRAKTLPEPTNITGEIRRTAAELLENCCSPRPRPIRLLGVGVTGFESSRQVQPSLFADLDREKETHLDQAADRIRKRFGSAPGKDDRIPLIQKGKRCHPADPRPRAGDDGGLAECIHNEDTL